MKAYITTEDLIKDLIKNAIKNTNQGYWTKKDGTKIQASNVTEKDIKELVQEVCTFGTVLYTNKGVQTRIGLRAAVTH